VLGIGKARARQLKRAGIKSVRNLAGADPEYVAGAVRGVSLDNAALLIEHAKKILAIHA
jgi:predicted RecB family nuclease